MTMDTLSWHFVPWGDVCGGFAVACFHPVPMLGKWTQTRASAVRKAQMVLVVCPADTELETAKRELASLEQGAALPICFVRVDIGVAATVIADWQQMLEGGLVATDFYDFRDALLAAGGTNPSVAAVAISRPLGYGVEACLADAVKGAQVECGAKVESARGLLLVMSAPPAALTLADMKRVSRTLQGHAPKALVLFNAIYDPSLGPNLRISIAVAVSESAPA